VCTYDICITKQVNMVVLQPQEQYRQEQNFDPNVHISKMRGNFAVFTNQSI
jgi:hypothetical protein